MQKGHIILAGLWYNDAQNSIWLLELAANGMEQVDINAALFHLSTTDTCSVYRTRIFLLLRLLKSLPLNAALQPTGVHEYQEEVSQDFPSNICRMPEDAIVSKSSGTRISPDTKPNLSALQSFLSGAALSPCRDCQDG